MLTRRILPHNEWFKLGDNPLRQAHPDSSRILVVEDEEGAIVGTWGILLLPHADGAWIDASHRHAGDVARHLLEGLFDELREAHIPHVLSHAQSPEIAEYLLRLGAQHIPGAVFLLPIPTVKPKVLVEV